MAKKVWEDRVRGLQPLTWKQEVLGWLCVGALLGLLFWACNKVFSGPEEPDPISMEEPR